MWHVTAAQTAAPTTATTNGTTEGTNATAFISSKGTTFGGGKKEQLQVGKELLLVVEKGKELLQVVAKEMELDKATG